MPLANCYIGVDPGKSGGISYILEDERWPTAVFANNMPKTDRDVLDMFVGISKLATNVYAVVEVVHSSPQMGVRSAWTFGRGYGALRMALVAAGIPTEDVTPQRWQRTLGCLTAGDKNITKARAQSMFPSVKCTHNVSDSLLLSEYCRRMRQYGNK